MRCIPYLLAAVLGISCVVSAGRCGTPKPVDNFNLNKFSGTWVEGACEPLNPDEYVTFQNTSCGYFHFLHKYQLWAHAEQGIPKTYRWAIDEIYGGNQKSDFRGTYFMPKAKEGFLKLFYESGNFTYDTTVVCTDYKTYAVIYMCAEVTPDFTSAFIVFLLRDYAMYEELVSNPVVQGCFRQLTEKPIRELVQVIHHDNCAPENVN